MCPACLPAPRAPIRRPVHKANERASGLAFAQYIRQHVFKHAVNHRDGQGVFVPNDMQEAVALAHLSVATGSEDDDEEVGTPWPTIGDGKPRLLPVPSAWWETPAVTTRALSARPEEARTARRFVRELLTCWGLEALADEGGPVAHQPRGRPDRAAAVHAQAGRRGHDGRGRSGQRDAYAQATRLGRGERARPADRRRAEPRVGLEPHRRARQGGLGRATRSLRAAPRTR